ncbi:MAG TPA: (2Fe-2S)-binding protein [Desulfobacteraceae bacterium]|nr:(2Fe-2S)-binding protein [Desulfobacteraceae bacterium]
MKIPLNLTINGDPVELAVDANETLLHVLRNSASLQSVHRSCEEGECGACTVLVNNEPVNSCLVLAVSVQGASVMTTEGLIRNNEPHPMMKAFTDELGIQCGFCTPGMLMTAYALINGSDGIELTDETIRESLQGNLCRCTGYVNIVKAVKKAKQNKDAGDWW